MNALWSQDMKRKEADLKEAQRQLSDAVKENRDLERRYKDMAKHVQRVCATIMFSDTFQSLLYPAQFPFSLKRSVMASSQACIPFPAHQHCPRGISPSRVPLWSANSRPKREHGREHQVAIRPRLP